jgi:hypothetical protein
MHMWQFATAAAIGSVLVVGGFASTRSAHLSRDVTWVSPVTASRGCTTGDPDPNNPDGHTLNLARDNENLTIYVPGSVPATIRELPGAGPMEVSLGYATAETKGSYWTHEDRGPSVLTAVVTPWHAITFDLSYKTGRWSPERPWHRGWVAVVSNEPGRAIIGGRGIEFLNATGPPWFRTGHWCWSDDFSNMRIEVTWPLPVPAIVDQAANAPNERPFKPTATFTFTSGPFVMNGMMTVIQHRTGRRGDVLVTAGSTIAQCATAFWAAAVQAGMNARIVGISSAVQVEAEVQDVFVVRGCGMTRTLPPK